MSGARARRIAGAVLVLFSCLCRASEPAATRDVSPIDLVDLEVTYDTLVSDYYQRVDSQRVIDGAHTGIMAYLRAHGIGDPRVPQLRANGRYAHDLHVPGQEVAGVLLRYGARLDPHALVYAAIAGEAAALHDPYTIFFTPQQERSFYRYLNPTSFGGIGVIVRVDHEHGVVIIDDVVPDGPAQKAGLVSGDWIWAVDGVPTSGLSADAIEKRLRGKAGTVVQVTYGRGETGSRTVARIMRAQVTPPDALAKLLPGGAGYLRLLSYGADSAKEVDADLARLEQQGAKAFVLDLRGNGGGYRQAAVDVTSRFVPPGPVVIVQARSGKRTTLFTRPGATPARPLAVLVDGATASAAEITAGAVADTKSGVLVGTRTFGKGLVQQMFPLPDGAALKVTVERYYTAHGRDIDGRGIDPDVAVAEPQGSIAGDEQRDPQLARALAALGITRTTPAP